MDTSDRINLIEALLTYFTSPGGPEFDRTDMALDEFRFARGPNLDFSDSEDYFRVRLRSGDDSMLVALSDHFQIRTQFSEEDTSMWEADRFRLFLSFNSLNAPFAMALRNSIRVAGIDGFLSHEDIDPNEEWQDVIEHALMSCHALAAVLTPDYHESKWTDQEVGWAYGRGVPVIAIRLGEDPYGFIGKKQAIRANKQLLAEEHPDVAVIRKEVLDTLWKADTCRPALESSVITALAESFSFEQTRFLTPYAEKCERPRDELIEKLDAATRENSQIYNALRSPISRNEPLLPRLRALIHRWRPRQPSLGAMDPDDLPFE